MVNTWFTSDFHLGHRNIIRYCNRPFQSTGEMDAAILDNLNNRVQQNDILYFLGDFCMGGPSQVARYRDRVVCRHIHVIEGNHDRAIRRLANSFSSTNQLAQIRIAGQGIVLCHYAMRVWQHSSRGAWHLYGHSHGNLKDTGEAKSDESRWMRFILDTVGKTGWTLDRQGRPIYPERFEELAAKLGRPLHPPGRDVRCIVSVGMLTEGWDCTTVTHIIGIRPFMSQLLCEQVVGRGLRRASYELGPDGKFTEEVSQVFGVPFEVIPFKANPQGPAKRREKRYHVHALPGKAQFEISFPRVEGYTQAIRNRITVDWASVPPLVLVPGKIPPEVEMKGLSVNNAGKQSLSGPGAISEATLAEFRAKRRVQELIFDLGRTLIKSYVAQPKCEAPAHVLFPQIVNILQRYVAEKVHVHPPADIKDLFLAPYYGWLVEILAEAIRPDTSQGEAAEVPRYEASRGPGSTAEVDFWTSREPREVLNCHVNYVVPDTQKWEQSAAYFIDKHAATAAMVKNAGLGFAIPYLHNGQMHDYMPDFIVRLKTGPPIHLILETKGFDPLEGVKRGAAERWVAAVNADGSYGTWRYTLVKRPTEVSGILSGFVGNQK